MIPSIKRQEDPILRAAFPVLVVFVFFIFSAVMESLPFIHNLRPQLILAALGLLAVVASGQFVKVLRTPIGICIALFTAWFIACIPFGVWPGGSFEKLTEVWYKAALIYFMTTGLLTTLPQANRLYHTIAYSAGILGVLTLLKNGRDTTGRLRLDNTRYANANDLALTLVLTLVFVGFLYLRGTRVQKVIAVLLVPPILLTLSRTGSRAGMLGLGVLFFVMLLQAKRTTRIKLMAGLAILLVAAVFLLPEGIRMRYTTLFGTVPESYDPGNMSDKLNRAAIGSAEGRYRLLIDSLILTMHHPLLGVGPGNFPVAQDQLAQARGEPSMWRVTHNMYTEVSSEMGLPGLIIYLALLFNAFKILNSIIRTRSPGPTWQNLRQSALTLRTAFIAFLPMAFFASVAYNTDVPILAGITTALGFMAQKQRAIDRAASAQTTAVEPPLQAGLEPVAVGQY